MSPVFLGEFVGTLVLILFGNGVVAAVCLNKSKAQNAGWLVIATGWGFAVTLGIITAKALGAPGSLNPVGPLADVILNKITLEKSLMMIGAQFLGAFCGATLVWLHYLPHWAETPDIATKRGAFCNSPAIRHTGANLTSEVIGTAALVFVGSAVGTMSLGNLEPTFVGIIVWAIGLSLGGTTGYAINPARDLGPRIAHALLPIAGKGSSDWGYAWIPVVGPCLGGVLGAVLFKWLTNS